MEFWMAVSMVGLLAEMMVDGSADLLDACKVA